MKNTSDRMKETQLHPSSLILHPFFAAYTGPSMNPTLVEPEIIEVHPYVDCAPQIGDVIYFHALDEHDIVHRIVAILPGGIRTRGDNNPRDDPWLVHASVIVGRVVAAHRGKMQRKIFGGRLGFAQHYFLRAWRRVNARVSRQLHAPYRQLARAGILRTLIPGRWRPRVVTFQATRLLMIGTRVIGRYDAQRRIWHIQRPFRLFVDEAEL